MFCELNALGEAFGRVVCVDCDFGLPQDLARIELARHEMDRSTRDAVTGLNRTLVRFQTAIFGQQRGVDVEYLALPALGKFGREDAHIACEHDVVRALIENGFLHQRIMFLALQSFVRLSESSDAFDFGQFQSGGILSVAGDKDNLVSRMRLTAGIEQRGHIGAGSRYQYRDSGFQGT